METTVLGDAADRFARSQKMTGVFETMTREQVVRGLEKIAGEQQMRARWFQTTGAQHVPVTKPTLRNVTDRRAAASQRWTMRVLRANGRASIGGIFHQRFRKSRKLKPSS